MDELTCWTLIRDAAAGEADAREEFARRYLPVVRSALGAQAGAWNGDGELEDAVQEVFVECLKEQGLLERARRGAGTGFRAFLHAACRNVGLRARTRRARRRESAATTGLVEALAPEETETLGQAFDRAWAEGLLREAALHQQRTAQAKGPEAVRRVELLRLRFQEGRAIRDIAEAWDLPPDFLHHEYAQARKEYERALRAVIAFHQPEDSAGVERELRELQALFGA